jgi:hypothetical protein
MPSAFFAFVLFFRKGLVLFSPDQT